MQKIPGLIRYSLLMYLMAVVNFWLTEKVKVGSISEFGAQHFKGACVHKLKGHFLKGKAPVPPVPPATTYL